MLGKYYKYAALYPAILVMLGNIIACIIIANEDFESEWLTADFIITIIIFMAFANAGIFCLLSATLFYNNQPRVYNNPWYSALAWMGAPGIYAGALLYKGYGDIFIIANTLPYLIALAATYIHFRQNKNFTLPS
jgi:hypothetical protein